MKKIIHGKAYDTDTAKELGSYENDGSWRDLGHWRETLYRKKTGEYFLHGEGGPMTHYAEASGQNSWRSGERIMPMTYHEAAEWAEGHFDAGLYEDIFGPVEEDNTKRIVTYNLTITSVEKLRRMAEQRGVSASELLDSLIQGA